MKNEQKQEKKQVKKIQNSKKAESQVATKENKKINKGITLIALVITIVVLIILAGISINLVLGDNGLFTRAKQATDEMKYASAQEKVQLAVLASYGNTGTLDANELKINLNKIEGLYKIVQEIEDDVTIKVDGYNFKINASGDVMLLENDEVVEDKTGEEAELKDEWKAEGNETVYAVSVGKEDIVPIPKNFYYVGGTINTGVIISDNENDKYNGKIDKAAYSYTTNLQGNQFVWIPSTEEEYKKIDWGASYKNAKVDMQELEEKGLEQIKKYGGFYVARYEAGLATTIEAFKEEQEYNRSAATTDKAYNVAGIPQSKAGVIPWNFITWENAKTNAENMYADNSYVESGLITGTQWDVILNTMISKSVINENDVKDSKSWGNYQNTAIPYTGRKSAIYEKEKNKFCFPAFGNVETSTTTSSTVSGRGDLLTTGASSATEKYHIFDMAGSLWEWTTEAVLDKSDCYMGCGGDLYHPSNIMPACCANYMNKACITINFGFRVVLYMQ